MTKSLYTRLYGAALRVVSGTKQTRSSLTGLEEASQVTESIVNVTPSFSRMYT